MESTYKRRQFDTLLEIFLAETIGTGLLMYFGCMGSISSLTKFESPPSIQGGLMFGFVVSSLIAGLGHISKAHLNPSVTLCAFFLGLINTSTAIVYVVAETIGALLGFYFLQGPFTGASMNPVRTLAPAIVNNEWDNHWLYWVAPLSGSAVTTSFYKYVFMRSLNTSTSTKLDGLNLLDSLKEREALNDDACEEKSLNIA